MRVREGRDVGLGVSLLGSIKKKERKKERKKLDNKKRKI